MGFVERDRLRKERPKVFQRESIGRASGFDMRDPTRWHDDNADSPRGLKLRLRFTV
jgi:hypothetical protein